MHPEQWKRVDHILQQALSRLPANRETFLDQACAGDEELRSEVESLLVHDRKASGFIASPPEKLASDLFAKDATELPAGTRIGSYRIQALVGRGGMGVVYRARDERLGRSENPPGNLCPKPATTGPLQA